MNFEVDDLTTMMVSKTVFNTLCTFLSTVAAEFLDHQGPRARSCDQDDAAGELLKFDQP